MGSLLSTNNNIHDTCDYQWYLMQVLEENLKFSIKVLHYKDVARNRDLYSFYHKLYAINAKNILVTDNGEIKLGYILKKSNDKQYLLLKIKELTQKIRPPSIYNSVELNTLIEQKRYSEKVNSWLLIMYTRFFENDEESDIVFSIFRNSDVRVKKGPNHFFAFLQEQHITYKGVILTTSFEFSDMLNRVYDIRNIVINSLTKENCNDEIYSYEVVKYKGEMKVSNTIIMLDQGMIDLRSKRPKESDETEEGNTTKKIRTS